MKQSQILKNFLLDCCDDDITSETIRHWVPLLKFKMDKFFFLFLHLSSNWTIFSDTRLAYKWLTLRIVCFIALYLYSFMCKWSIYSFTNTQTVSISFSWTSWILSLSVFSSASKCRCSETLKKTLKTKWKIPKNIHKHICFTFYSKIQ